MANADVQVSLVLESKAVAKALDDLTRKVNRFGQQAARSTQQASKGVASMTDALYLFERRISTVTRAFQLLGAGAALSVFKNFVDQAQSANNAIKSITVTQEQFNAVQVKTLEVANKTGESFRATATGVVRVYRSIEGMGGTAAQALKVVENLNKTLVVSGATGSEATSTLIQFTQALQSGVLQGDELRSLRENAPLAMQAIAKAAGVSVAELKKMGSEGKLTTEILIKAFTAPEFTARLDELKSRIDRTFSQSLAVAGNNFAIFFSKLEESAGVLKTLGNGIVLLSESLSLIAENKFAISMAASLAVLARVTTAIKVLGGVATLTTQAMFLLGVAASRLRTALVALVVANPILTGIAVVTMGVATAMDMANRRAKDLADKIAIVRNEVELTNMKYIDIMRPEDIKALSDAETQLKVNADRQQELNKYIKQQNSLLGKGREEADIARFARISRATEELNALKAVEAQLVKNTQKWREYAEAQKRSASAREIIENGEQALKVANLRLATAKEALITGDMEIAGMKAKLVLDEQDLALKTKAGAVGSARYDLVMRQLDPQRESIRITEEAIKLEELLNKKKEKKPKDYSNLFDSYAADLKKAGLEGQGLAELIQAMNSGDTEEGIQRLRDKLVLEEQLIDIRKRYKDLPGGSKDLEAQARANANLNASYADSLRAYQQLTALRQEVIDSTFEEYAASQELAAIKSGASQQQLEDLRAELEIREKYSLLTKEEIERMVRLDKERRNTLKTLADVNQLLADQKAAGEAVGTTIGQGLAAIATGAATAEEAVKRLVAQLLEAIAQAAILQLFNQSGPNGFWGDVLGSLAGGGARTLSNSPSIRIINLQGGGITKQTSPSGDVTITIGQMASAVQRGGNPLALAIERTYGLGRRGV